MAGSAQGATVNYDFVIPYGRDHIGDRPFAIAVSVATRADFVAYQSEND